MKGQAMGFMAILISLILLVTTTLVSYEAVTGVSVTRFMGGNTAQDLATELNIAMLSPYTIRSVADCPKGAFVEIHNGRATVYLKKFFKEETISAYYIVPKGAELPQNVRAVCNESNFFRVEKWKWPDGTPHLSVKATNDFEYTALCNDEPCYREWCCNEHGWVQLDPLAESTTHHYVSKGHTQEVCEVAKRTCDELCRSKKYDRGVETLVGSGPGTCDSYRQCECSDVEEDEEEGWCCSGNGWVRLENAPDETIHHYVPEGNDQESCSNDNDGRTCNETCRDNKYNQGVEVGDSNGPGTCDSYRQCKCSGKLEELEEEEAPPEDVVGEEWETCTSENNDVYTPGTATLGDTVNLDECVGDDIGCPIDPVEYPLWHSALCGEDVEGNDFTGMLREWYCEENMLTSRDVDCWCMTSEELATGELRSACMRGGDGGAPEPNEE